MKLCAFTSSNENYLMQAVASLTSAKKWQPELDLFFLTEKLSSTGELILKSYGIEPIITSLDGHFTRFWSYPRECYYLFAAPEILLRLGYGAGFYIDADTIVNGDLRSMPQGDHFISGVSVGKVHEILKNDILVLEAEFGNIASENRIQSGVLYMLFKPLVDLKFLDKVSWLYDKCFAIGAPRKGDDSLLALSQAMHREFQWGYSNPSFNMIEYKSLKSGSPAWHQQDEDTLTKDGVFHFTAKSAKPWDMPDNFPTFRSKYFTNKWLRHVVDVVTEDHIFAFFPKVSTSLSDNHLKFYWYPEVNVGDQITPYFNKRLSNSAIGSITEKEINTVEIASPTKRAIDYFDKKILKRGQLKTANYIVSCGSLARLCGSRALVFGSGIRSAKQNVGTPLIRFVRGPLTRNRYVENGTECPAIYGDPALLLPRIFFPKVEKKYRLGFIPHFTEFKQFEESFEIKHENTLLDTRTTDVECFILKLLQCERTVSSSLQGLIFSHAYQIPTRHVVLTGSIFGDGTKFKDHYEAVNIPYKPLALTLDDLDQDKLFDLAYEVSEFDDRFLWDEMYFNENGLKKSTKIPF